MKKLVMLVAVATMVAFASCGAEKAEEKKCDKPCPEATEEVAPVVEEEVIIEEVPVAEEAPATEEVPAEEAVAEEIYIVE